MYFLRLPLVRLEDSVTRQELESITPALDRLTSVKQNTVKVNIRLIGKA